MTSARSLPTHSYGVSLLVTSGYGRETFHGDIDLTPVVLVTQASHRAFRRD